MTGEATMPVRNTGPRAPRETPDARATSGVRAATLPFGAEAARAQGASSGPASRPFEESMTQAMRRAQSKPSGETRESGEREPGNDNTDAADATTAGASDEAASSPAAPPASAPPREPAQEPTQEQAAAPVAPSASAGPDDAEPPAETTLAIADTQGTAGNAASALANDASTARTTSPSAASNATSDETLSSAARGAAAKTRADAAGEAAESASTGAASDAPPAGELPPAGADASKLASSDSHSRTAGADSLVARSTADFAAQLAHARGAARSTDAAGASASTSNPAVLHRSDVSTSIGDALFPGRFAAEVALLGTAGIERAEIRLQPRELGPVRIELSLNGESTRIAFSAVQPETRQAIEQSLPILKDLLAERGLTLGEASVSDGQAGHGSAEPEARPSHAASKDATDAAAADRPFAADRRHTPIRRTLLDVYA